MQLDRSILPLLVSGGAGYIGTHTVIELMKAGFTNIVIIDNYINSSPESIRRLRIILNQELSSSFNANPNPKYNLQVYNLDLADCNTANLTDLNTICKQYRFFACIHFAGLKAVGESVSKPLLYYQNNLNSTLNLINSLSNNNCYNIIFSSSATVYGSNVKSPITENNDIGHCITNPYGQTKFMIEQILTDMKISLNNKYNIVNLRYFNPIGAHISGLIGEDPKGIPNNLMPYLLQVAIGRREYLSIFGNNYNTRDGTGIRDYIHVCDLAKGHVKALEMDIIPNTIIKMNNNNNISEKFSKTNNISVYNLGTGNGTTVLELKNALEKVSGVKINHKFVERRKGDIDIVYANCDLAFQKLGWKAELTIEDACRDSWRWQKNNPMGFDTKSSVKSKL